MIPLTVSAIGSIERLFESHGTLIYGERVTQREHALQCATLAADAGASDALVTAALLHDIGHMLHRDAAGALAAGMNDAHEVLGFRFLSKWFPPAVTVPVALHVQAKRFLCRREPDHHDRLSPVSQQSLELQGGPMSDAEASAFAAREFACDAVMVRRWDDIGKRSSATNRSWDQLIGIAASCITGTGRSA